MKTKLFSIFLTLLLVSTVYLPLSVAEDYTTWALPEGAKARLGKGTIEDIQFSPDNKLLVVAGSIGVWIYDVDTDEELALLTGHTGLVKSIAFSPDGETLASASWDYTIRLWNVSTFSLNKTLTGHTSAVTSVAFSTDGWTLASGSVDNTIRLWDVITGSTKKIFEGHTDRVTSVAFGPDDALLVSGSWDKTVRLWDVARGEHKQTFTGHTDRVTSVSFSQNPMIPLLASGSWDRTIRLWDVETGELKQTLTNARMGSVDSVGFRSDGYMLISSSFGGFVRIWATLSGALKQEVPVGYSPSGPNVCFSPDGGMFASVGQESAIRLWYMTPKRNYEVSIMSTDPSPYRPVRLVLSRDSKTAAGFMPGWLETPEVLAWKIRTWDVSTGQLKAILTAEDQVTVHDIRFSPDGQTLASVGLVEYQDPVYVTLGAIVTDQVLYTKTNNSLTIRLWDVSNGRLKQSFRLHGPPKQPSFLNTRYNRFGYWGGVFSPDGLTLASVKGTENNGNVISLFNASTGELKQSFSVVPADLNPLGPNINFSPDSRTLITGHGDGTIHLWDVATGNLKQTLLGHTGNITRVAFSPDGKTMASTSYDNTVRLWDAATGEHLHTFAPGSSNDDWWGKLMFSRDGKTVTSYDSWYSLVEDSSEFIWHRSADLYYWYSIIPNAITPRHWEHGPGGFPLWDITTGEEIQSENGFFAVSGQFVPDGEGLTLLTIRLGEGFHDGQHFRGYTLVSLDLSGVTPKGETEPERGHKQQTFTGHSGWVHSVSFGPDGKTLAVGSEDAIRLWDVDTPTPTLKDLYPVNATTVAFSSAHQRFLSGSWDSTVRLWHVGSNSQEKTFTGHTDSINSVEFTIGSREFASGSSDKTVRLWNVGIGETTQTFTGHTDRVLTLAVNPHQTGDVFLASGGVDKTVHLWQRSREEPLRTLTGHTDAVLSVAYNPNLHNVSAHPDLVDAVLDPHNVSLDPDLEAEYVAERGGLIAVQGSGYQVMLASGGADKTIHLWDGVGGAHMGTLTGHNGSVTSLAFSPDGKVLMSGSSDATIRWWELGKVVEAVSLKDPDQTVIWEDPFIGRHKHTLIGHTGGVTSLAFSPVTGWTLASGSYDGTVLLWDVRFEPSKPEGLVTDINDDGVVNIQDLVIVASNFGATGENAADVNDDGVVNIQDLVQVAGQLGNAAAAPSTWGNDLAFAPTRAEVERWLTQAQALNLTDAISQRGIRFLEQLLLALTPKETALFANYPNPFNPETWIPYQLAAPGNITIEIHAIDGSLVRTLPLGHKTVGIYQTRSRAAYWDGRNEIGEPVASGVYFYTLTAGEFSATRKMLIRK